MDKLVYLLPILACPIMMGVMMFTMRGNHAGHEQAQRQPDPNTLEEIAMLRAEIAALRSQQTDAAAPGTRP